MQLDNDVLEKSWDLSSLHNGVIVGAMNEAHSTSCMRNPSLSYIQTKCKPSSIQNFQAQRMPNMRRT